MSIPNVVDSSRPAGAPATVWELYNEKARQRDNVLLKDWNSSINSLLLFAAIFAAVLTSFCIESLQLLRPDPQDSLANIQKALHYMALKDTNISHLPPLPPTNFVPPQWAVALNALLFASLVASILAGIGSVICLQWVGEYNAGLEDASTPKQRALRWHYRYRATDNWYMRHLIAALPILLGVAVTLFLIGLEEWFASLCPRLRFIPLVGVMIWAGGYAITNMLAVIFPSAPYRTPMSRLIFRVLWLAHYYCWSSIQVMINLYRPFMHYLRHIVTPRDRKYRNQYNVEKAVSSLKVKDKLNGMYTWMPPGRHPWQSMHAHIRERGRVDRDSTVRFSAISWLANSIDLSEHSKPHFQLIIEELANMDDRRLRHWTSYSRDVPWSYIFNLFVPSEGIIATQNSVSPETLTGLLEKMSNHPKLFAPIISELQGNLAVLFVEALAKRPPSNPEEASNRLRSITALLSSKVWEAMGSLTQPCLAAMKIIFDCLDEMRPDVDISTSWIFTLRHPSPTGGEVEWPNPEFIGFIFDPFRNEMLRERSIHCYIRFVDCLLTGGPLPTKDTRWRWYITTVMVRDDYRIYLLRILAEHVLRISSTLGGRVDLALLDKCADMAKSSALQLILRTCGTRRENSDMILNNDEDGLWKDDSWMYAVEFWFSLHGAWEAPYCGGDPSRHQPKLIEIVAKMIGKHHASLDKTVAQVCTRYGPQMMLESWIQVVDAVLMIHRDPLTQRAPKKPEASDHEYSRTMEHYDQNIQQYSRRMERYSQDIRQYCFWMVHVNQYHWVQLFARFESDSVAIELLIDILRQYLQPVHHWRGLAEIHVPQRPPPVSSSRFTRLVEAVMTKKSSRAPISTNSWKSPLPPLLDQARDILRLRVYDNDQDPLINASLTIIDNLAYRYGQSNQSDREMREAFKQIEMVLRQILREKYKIEVLSSSLTTPSHRSPSNVGPTITPPDAGPVNAALSSNIATTLDTGGATPQRLQAIHATVVKASQLKTANET